MSSIGADECSRHFIGIALELMRPFMSSRESKGVPLPPASPSSLCYSPAVWRRGMTYPFVIMGFRRGFGLLKLSSVKSPDRHSSNCSTCLDIIRRVGDMGVEVNISAPLE